MTDPTPTDAFTQDQVTTFTGTVAEYCDTHGLTAEAGWVPSVSQTQTLDATPTIALHFSVHGGDASHNFWLTKAPNGQVATVGPQYYEGMIVPAMEDNSAA